MESREMLTASPKISDLVELDLSKDGDACSTNELKDHYQNPYYCFSRKAIGLQKLIILHLDSQWETNKLATALSNNSFHISTCDTLEKISTFVAHDQNIVDVHFSPKNYNYLFSASNDGLVRMWDIRNPQNCCLEFKGDNGAKHPKPLLSFDVNCNGQMLCAGTEKIKEDSFLLFWDVRSSKLVGGYWESHQDDISHIQFHPLKPDMMASCSTDCLVNVFDLNQGNEDDALQFSLNTQESCGRLQWLGNISSTGNHRLSVITHTEDLQIWDVEEATLLHRFSRDLVKQALKRRNAETCYIIRCIHVKEDHNPLVLAGSSTPNRGCLRLLTIKNGCLEPFAVLYDQKGLNSQVVRCAAYNPINGQIISGGEDGIINVWLPGEEKSAPIDKTMVEMPSRKSQKHRSETNKPYSKK